MPGLRAELSLEQELTGSEWGCAGLFSDAEPALTRFKPFVLWGEPRGSTPSAPEVIWEPIQRLRRGRSADCHSCPTAWAALAERESPPGDEGL